MHMERTSAYQTYQWISSACPGAPASSRPPLPTRRRPRASLWIGLVQHEGHGHDCARAPAARAPPEKASEGETGGGGCVSFRVAGKECGAPRAAAADLRPKSARTIGTVSDSPLSEIVDIKSPTRATFPASAYAFDMPVRDRRAPRSASRQRRGPGRRGALELARRPRLFFRRTWDGPQDIMVNARGSSALVGFFAR